MDVDLTLIDFYDQLLNHPELTILRPAKEHDVRTLSRLRSVPGAGKILGLAILYEVHNIDRFPRVNEFLCS